MPEIYICTDVETDGPIPGPHSMLSLASAAYTADKRLVSTFSANLETLPDASSHTNTAEWWATQPEAWAACRSNLEDPAAAMRRYVDWVGLQPGKPVAAPRALRADLQLELGHRGHQPAGLAVQAFCGGRAFFDQGRVLLRDLIHLAEHRADLRHAGALL